MERLFARYDSSPAIMEGFWGRLSAIIAALLGQHSIHKRLAVGNEFWQRPSFSIEHHWPLTDTLATPHSGSSLATYGSALATITKYCSPLNPPQALLETLRKDSQVLLELTADFIAKASQLQIASFYEMKMTRLGLMKKMVHPTTLPVRNGACDWHSRLGRQGAFSRANASEWSSHRSELGSSWNRPLRFASRSQFSTSAQEVGDIQGWHRKETEVIELHIPAARKGQLKWELKLLHVHLT